MVMIMEVRQCDSGMVIVDLGSWSSVVGDIQSTMLVELGG